VAGLNASPAMCDFEQVTHLTFDCYGTLIDWETGILESLMPLLNRSRAAITEEQLLRQYVQYEAEEESGPYKPYREILANISAHIGDSLGMHLNHDERSILPNSVGDWPPFSDSITALGRLKKRYKLVIVSNIDDSLFAATQRTLGVHFDEIVTAEQVRSYKPSPNHFAETTARLKVPKEQILHVAQSIYHDLVPARSFGLSMVRINRWSRLAGLGLALPAPVTPKLELPDLASLSDLLIPRADQEL